MKDLWNDNIKIHLQHLMPVISSIIFILLFYIPAYPFVAENIRPCIPYICIYFWLVNRPDIFGITYAFIIAFVADIASTSPAGTDIFALLILYLTTTSIYKFVSNKPFNIVWFGFIIVSALTLLAKWLIVSLYYSQFLAFSNVIFTFLSTIAFYPIFSVINVYIHVYFMQEE
ncbi:MAG: rod shape-determining protein MreD [Alphaproteobacteria bacterium]